MKLVLASGSAWRRMLLESAGVPCATVPPEVDEAAIRDPDPVVTARLRAAAKARAVAAGLPADTLAIGADQVVHLDGQALGKPEDEARHLAMLRALRGRTHDLVTAVVLAWGGGGGEPAVARRFEVTSRLAMRADLSDAELRAYVASGDGRGCGGGYRVEGLGLQLFSAVEGDWTNIVGLPVPRLVSELRALGWRPFGLADPAGPPAG